MSWKIMTFHEMSWKVKSHDSWEGYEMSCFSWKVIFVWNIIIFGGLSLHMCRICFLWMLWTCSMGRLSRFFLSWFSMIFMVFHDFHETFLVHACHEISCKPFSFFSLWLPIVLDLYTNKSNQSQLTAGVVRPTNMQRVPLNVKRAFRWCTTIHTDEYTKTCAWNYNWQLITVVKAMDCNRGAMGSSPSFQQWFCSFFVFLLFFLFCLLRKIPSNVSRSVLITDRSCFDNSIVHGHTYNLTQCQSVHTLNWWLRCEQSSWILNFQPT